MHGRKYQDIVLVKFREKSLKIDDILQYISDMAINHRFFLIYRMINVGQRGQTRYSRLKMPFWFGVQLTYH